MLLPVVCEAVPVIDFNMAAPTTGIIRHDGGGAPLLGQNISVDNVVGIDTDTHTDVALTIFNGLLSFSTGGRVATDQRNWYFAPGGTFRITGRLDLNGNHVADAGEIVQTLFDGVFTDVVTVNAITSSFRIISGGFAGVLAPALAGFYGVPAADVAGGLNLSFSSTRMPPQSFSSTQPLSGDAAVTIPAPEASTLLLLGIAMIATGVYVRRPKRLPED